MGIHNKLFSLANKKLSKIRIENEETGSDFFEFSFIDILGFWKEFLWSQFYTKENNICLSSKKKHTDNSLYGNISLRIEIEMWMPGAHSILSIFSLMIPRQMCGNHGFFILYDK